MDRSGYSLRAMATQTQDEMFVPAYDRYLLPVPCDRCQRTATWTLRVKYAGESPHEVHVCNIHRRSQEQHAREGRRDGSQPLRVERISRQAF